MSLLEKIEDHSVVNRIMFMPPTPDYTIDATTFYIPDSPVAVLCKLYLYTEGTEPNGSEGRYFNKHLDTSIPVRGIIVYCHGNACNIASPDIHQLIVSLSEATQCHVLLMEYPGYEPNTSSAPTTSRCKLAMDAVIKFLLLDLGVPASDLIFVGQSIGTGVATYGASVCSTAYGHSIDTLVLISPYRSINDLAGDLVSSSSRGLIMSRFDNTKAITRCGCNILIIHGERDEVIPVSHGKDLAEIAKKHGHFVYTHYPPRADHNNFNVKADIIEQVRRVSTITCSKNRKHKVYSFKEHRLAVIPMDVQLNDFEGGSCLSTSLATTAELSYGSVSSTVGKCTLI